MAFAVGATSVGRLATGRLGGSLFEIGANDFASVETRAGHFGRQRLCLLRERTFRVGRIGNSFH